MTETQGEKFLGMMEKQNQIFGEERDAILKMSESIESSENVKRLMKFAQEAFERINETTVMLDALSVALFEQDIIKQERFQEIIRQIMIDNKNRQELQQNETERTGDSVTTQE